MHPLTKPASRAVSQLTKRPVPDAAIAGRAPARDDSPCTGEPAQDAIAYVASNERLSHVAVAVVDFYAEAV